MQLEDEILGQTRITCPSILHQGKMLQNHTDRPEEKAHQSIGHTIGLSNPHLTGTVE